MDRRQPGAAQVRARKRERRLRFRRRRRGARRQAPVPPL